MPKPYKIEPIFVPRFKDVNGFYTSPARSKVMSKIRSKNTKPEIIFRKELWKRGLRYRTHVKDIPGSPDIIMKKYKVIIFIDGEFWHGYNWNEKKEKIKTNRDFWIPKIERNMQRDQQNNEKLLILGYKVFRFWEHSIKKELQSCINEVTEYIEALKTH
ncbi:very short patch repair endonuclease [Flavobacterium hauense]